MNQKSGKKSEEIQNPLQSSRSTMHCSRLHSFKQLPSQQVRRFPVKPTSTFKMIRPSKSIQFPPCWLVGFQTFKKNPSKTQLHWPWWPCHSPTLLFFPLQVHPRSLGCCSFSLVVSTHLKNMLVKLDYFPK